MKKDITINGKVVTGMDIDVAGKEPIGQGSLSGGSTI